MLSIFISLVIFFSTVQEKKPEIKNIIKKDFDLIENAEYEEALRLFDKVLKIDKNCKEAYLGKGIAYYKSGNYDTRKIYPEEFIKKAIKIDNKYASLTMSIVRFIFFGLKKKWVI